MNYKDKDVTIGGVVAELPKASTIFRSYGIDFCCGGHRKLSDVIQEQKLDAEAIYEELSKAQEERENNYKGINFNEMSPSALSNYIEDKHHSYLRGVLPDISELLGTILRVHGKNHRELFDVYRLYGVLKTDLEQHLLKEETMLFPTLAEDEINHEEAKRLSTEIITEHEAAGKILEELNRLTNHYHAPADACQTYHKTYALLEELEQDLHEHIHLENNILLKEYDHR